MKTIKIDEKEFWLVPKHISPQTLETCLEDLDLSEKSYTALAEDELWTLGHVLCLTEKEVGRYPEDVRNEIEILFTENEIDIKLNNPI